MRLFQKELSTIQKIYGNLTGLKPIQIKRLEQFYRRRVPPDAIVTQEMARQLTELSRELNRQLGVLLSRRGEVAFVIVGTHKGILIPSLEGFRSSSARSRGSA